MESSLDKQRILEIYLNVVEFSPGIYGIEAASQHFFYKPAKNLTDNESALLAAVLTDPEHYRADSPSAVVEQLQRKIMSEMKTLDLSALLTLANNS
jgi:monofunctional biosynthetic peptidoglycan transglycosylase